MRRLVGICRVMSRRRQIRTRRCFLLRCVWMICLLLMIWLGSTVPVLMSTRVCMLNALVSMHKKVLMLTGALGLLVIKPLTTNDKPSSPVH